MSRCETHGVENCSICEHRPKQFTCICGSKIFVLTRLQSLIVDFGKEGAVEGHPQVNTGSSGKESLVCFGCHTKIPDVVADKMLKDII